MLKVKSNKLITKDISTEMQQQNPEYLDFFVVYYFKYSVTKKMSQTQKTNNISITTQQHSKIFSFEYKSS